MRNRKIFGALAATIVLGFGLLVGGSLYAQQRDDAQMGMMGMMAMMNDCPMHAAMAESPAAVLKQGNELGLSPEQVARIEALEARTAAAHKTAMQEMPALHKQIKAASSEDRFDEVAARRAFDRMGDLHTEMGVAMMRTGQELRGVLTSEQRKKLTDLRPGGMHGMMGMMMGGSSMEDCPMMGGKTDAGAQR